MKISLIDCRAGPVGPQLFQCYGPDQREWTQCSSADVDRIIQAFTAKEAEFRRALNSYSFKRDALMQSIGMGGQVIGEYHRVSTFTFDDQGNRYEKISFFPMSSMPEVTAEDIEDLGGIEPFALEPSKIAKYNIRYAGKEKIDELESLHLRCATESHARSEEDERTALHRSYLGRRSGSANRED